MTALWDWCHKNGFPLVSAPEIVAEFGSQKDLVDFASQTTFMPAIARTFGCDTVKAHEIHQWGLQVETTVVETKQHAVNDKQEQQASSSTLLSLPPSSVLITNALPAETIQPKAEADLFRDDEKETKPSVPPKRKLAKVDASRSEKLRHGPKQKIYGKAQCLRCNKRVTVLKDHPTLHHPALRYCYACFLEMQFDNADRWVGRPSRDDKPLIKYCGLCWCGAEGLYRKEQLVCDNANCPNRECFICVGRTRQKLHTALFTDLTNTPFVCFQCHKTKKKDIVQEPSK